MPVCPVTSGLRINHQVDCRIEVVFAKFIQCKVSGFLFARDKYGREILKT